MLNFLVALTSFVASWFALWFSQRIFPLSPAILALLCVASSASSTPDLASKPSVLTFVRSNPYICGEVERPLDVLYLLCGEHYQVQ